MSDLVLPDGAYFSVIGNVRISAGGQTRLALLRHRLFRTYAGVELPIVTYNPVPSYEPIRAEMRSTGQLMDDSPVLNLYEDLRARDLTALPTVRVPAGRTGSTTDDVDDSYTWRRRVLGASGEDTAWEFLRPDGSLYARTPPTNVDGAVAVFDQQERPAGSWPTLGGLWRWWTSQIVPPRGRVFLISDSRFVADELGLLDDPRIHLMHQMHNPHLTGARVWSSPVSESYRDSMDHIRRFDGLLSLTERQRDDIAARYGATNNLFVVPNPVEPAVEPDPSPARRPHAIAMIARLDGQKRIDRAIDAFATVAAAVPEATLDIHGDGELRDELQGRIDTADLGDRITLHGHDPHAREALWTASLFWLTSEFEGYPLSTLEAMSHGVPVVSMDMPYGPREQITDGVDGVLVPFGDIAVMAERTIALLQGDLEPMRTAARAKAAAHGHQQFLADWQRVLEQVVELKSSRVEAKSTWYVDADLDGDPITFDGALELDTSHAVDEVEVVAQAWSPNNPELITIPMQVERDGSEFSFEGSAPREDLMPDARIRVGFVCRNVGEFVPIADPPRRSARSVIGAALRRTGLRR